MHSDKNPRGFLAAGWNIGIKDDSYDFGVIHSEVPCNAAAVFTRNNIPGNPILVGKKHIADGNIQTIVVNSKNANVATGNQGYQDSLDICQMVAESLRIPTDRVFPSSTGVIGRPLPMSIIEKACASIPERLVTDDFDSFARAIMTTDTHPKLVQTSGPGGVLITGVAKGAGMIEPNMATMLSYIVTDARISAEDLQWLARFVADRSFNRVSIDADTSTSDTFVVMANGLSGVEIEIDEDTRERCHAIMEPDDFATLDGVNENNHSFQFIRKLLEMGIELARMIARDGEGATKLVELRVQKAASRQRALKIGRSVINSPLVKTAIYGADPNWGRLIMAIGKVFDEPVQEEQLEIYFGPHRLIDSDQNILDKISHYMKEEPTIQLRIVLNEGNSSERLWGCDLTEEYVRINAMYTT